MPGFWSPDCRNQRGGEGFDKRKKLVLNSPLDLIPTRTRFPHLETNTMKTWSKPEFRNLRYGFEINLYVKVR